MQKSSGDPICTGFLVDASAGLCPAGMALLKRYMHLFSCIGLPAAVGTAPAPINKNRNIPQPEGSAEKIRNHFQHEGRQAKSDTRPAGYEAAGGQKEIQWLPGISPDMNRLDKKGVWGLPSAFW